MNQLRDYQENSITAVKQSYLEGYKRPCVILPCGAGKSIVAAEIAKRTTDKGNRVLFIVHRIELCEQIGETFANWGVDMSLCQISMVQTVTKHLGKTVEPNLIICDEGHHSIANSYKRIYEYFNNSRSVGFTATPIRLNGGGLGEINDKLIIGPTVKELISRNCLSDFDYYAPSVADLSGLHTRAGEYVAEEIEQALSKPHIYGDVIKYYRELSDGKQAICYCATIKYSKDMTEQFQAAGITAEHIDGSTPKSERAEIIRKFRSGEILILCNVDLISEGFDVPDCNTAILLRPTKSLTLFIQQSMRCMRYKPDKRAVVIDHVGNVHRFGLPSQDREWSLTPKKSSEKSETAVLVKQCPECFYTHEPAPICPNCGHVYEPERKSPKEVKATILQKITDKVINYTGPAECSSFSELAIFGKLHGRKPGWAYHTAKTRGLIH